LLVRSVLAVKVNLPDPKCGDGSLTPSAQIAEPFSLGDGYVDARRFQCVREGRRRLGGATEAQMDAQGDLFMMWCNHILCVFVFCP